VVHRVLQEALTNVLRHAPGSRATVDVHHAVGRVEVSVANSTAAFAGETPSSRGGWAAGSTQGSGRGLAGMRERVEVLGGRVTSGPRSDGGFEVRVLLPATRTAEQAR
jgi:signal transduction histidine kinase